MKALVVIVCMLLASFGYSESLKPMTIFYFEPPNISPVLRVMESNLSCTGIGIDETCIILKSNVDYKIKFLYQSLECEKCSLIERNAVEPGHSQRIVLKFASFGTAWEVINEESNETLLGSNHTYFGENSWYTIYINKTYKALITEKEPEFIYTPILIALGAYILLACVWIFGTYLHRKGVFNNLFHRDSMDELAAAYSSSSTIDDKKQKQARQRLRSLDTVRGITIVLMIFVNYGGGKYWFFHHARWNGLTFADLVFPWFIWMMGMSMALSLRSQLRKVVSRKKIFLKILKRSIILFALGIMLNTYCTVVDLQKIRIPGVLQRFSISYFVVATVHMFFASAEDDNVSASWSAFRDIFSYWGEWIIMIGILGIHVILTFVIHDPNCPKGYLGPGGLHDGGKYSLCIGGAANYIDRMVLSRNHIYQNPSSNAIYHSQIPHDPEGILGILTSIFLVFLGLQAGKILLTYKEWKPRVIRWLTWALVTGAIAALLCKCTKNDGWIPVNKNLWSVSFVLATGSLAFLLISICYIIIDVQNWWTGAPFYYAGMNSIMLYVGHSMTHRMFPWSWQVPPTHMNALFLNLWGTSLWVIISIWMYHKNIFVAV